MKLSAAQLKSALKKLDAVDSAEVWLDTAIGFVAAQDANLQMLAVYDFLKSSTEGGQTRVCVNRRQLQSIVNRGKGDIDLSFELGIRAVTAKSAFDLPGLDKQMTVPKPRVVVGDPATSTSFALAPLKEMLAYAGTAAERKQNFLYTGTLQLSETRDKRIAVGTNGSRLAFAENQSTCGLDKDLLLNLPLSLVSAIQKMEAESVWLGETEQAVYAAIGGADSSVIAIARRMAVTWPDYRSFIPKEYSFSAQIDAQAAAEALDEVSPMVAGLDAKAASLTPAVTLLFDEGKLTFTASGSGRADSQCDYEQIEPDPIFSDLLRRSITISHRYLTDFFGSVKGCVKFSMNEPTTPVWLEAGEKKLLVAPIRTKGMK
jgi:DNA polymerase III sliding clamp (beta) subunit (PCNA family)